MKTYFVSLTSFDGADEKVMYQTTKFNKEELESEFNKCVNLLSIDGEEVVYYVHSDTGSPYEQLCSVELYNGNPYRQVIKGNKVRRMKFNFFGKNK